MNRTDILKALISRSISPEEVRSALDDAQNFLGTVNALEAIDGVKITVDVNAQVFPANEWDVAKCLVIPVEKLHKFKVMNPRAAYGFSASSNIPLIKLFRENFNTGLADSCWALEMLYAGMSDRSHGNYAS